MRRTVLVPTLLLAALAGAPQVAAADMLVRRLHSAASSPRGSTAARRGRRARRNLAPSGPSSTTSASRTRFTSSAGVNVGGEVLFGLGDFLEAGVGIGYYQSKERVSFYTDFTDTDGPTSSRDQAPHRAAER